MYTQEDATGWTNVVVTVPSERVSEFYQFVADWLGAPPASTDDQVEVDEDLHSRALRWWRSLRLSERAIWGLWLDEAPSAVSAAEIVSRLQLTNSRSIPGILRWSAAKGKKAGFPVGWRFYYDGGTGAPMYGLSDVEIEKDPPRTVSALEYAEIVRAARQEVGE